MLLFHSLTVIDEMVQIPGEEQMRGLGGTNRGPGLALQVENFQNMTVGKCRKTEKEICSHTGQRRKFLAELASNSRAVVFSLWSFDIDPHVVVTPAIKLFLLLLHNCMIH